MPAILKAAADAGAQFAGYVPVRLPFAVKDLFTDWLDKYFPDRKNKILGRIRDIRAGKLNNSDFHTRMSGTGPLAEQLSQMFDLAKRRAGITEKFPPLSRDHFRRPVRAGGQMELW
jgi:DNA repair photolyase